MGDLLIVAGTVCWASYIALSKPILSSVSPLQFVTYTVILGSPIVIFASLPSLLSLDLRTVSWENWGIISYSALLSIGVAYTIWYSSVQRIGTARTAIYQNLVPLIAVVIAWQILGEQLLTRQLLGGAMIFLGIYLTRFSN
ncbi:MAG: DMT family transporter [Candidatus Bathyarchaeia archaeon]